MYKPYWKTRMIQKVECGNCGEKLDAYVGQSTVECYCGNKIQV